MANKKPGWIPERQDIIWIDCNPQAGREMRDIHPFLVLSPQAFNARTSLVIGLPMTTAEYNADNPFAISTGPVTGSNDGNKKRSKKGKTSYVLCHQPKFFDWRIRKAAPHPARKLAAKHFQEVCTVLNQIIQVG